MFEHFTFTMSTKMLFDISIWEYTVGIGVIKITYCRSHSSHLNIFPSPWVPRCCLRSELVAKDLSQRLHLNFFSFRCTRLIWVFKLYCLLKVWLQCWHVALTSFSLAGCYFWQSGDSIPILILILDFHSAVLSFKTKI